MRRIRIVLGLLLGAAAIVALFMVGLILWPSIEPWIGPLRTLWQ